MKNEKTLIFKQARSALTPMPTEPIKDLRIETPQGSFSFHPRGALIQVTKQHNNIITSYAFETAALMKGLL